MKKPYVIFSRSTDFTHRSILKISHGPALRLARSSQLHSSNRSASRPLKPILSHGLDPHIIMFLSIEHRGLKAHRRWTDSKRQEEETNVRTRRPEDTKATRRVGVQERKQDENKKTRCKVVSERLEVQKRRGQAPNWIGSILQSLLL